MFNNVLNMDFNYGLSYSIIKNTRKMGIDIQMLDE